MMESLRISEARPYSYGSNERRTKESRHRIPRLPTPEESRSSTEALERQGASDISRLASPYRATYTHRSPHGTLAVGNIETSRSHRQHASPPDSPPYGGYDLQRPSLPPLKTVLGDSLSSPPQTPTSYGPSGPLSPREPAFTTTTYKPPSLYPNKKQRTGFVLEPVSSTLPASALSSPGAPTAVQYPRVTNASQPPPSAYHSPIDVQATRRMSVRYQPGCSPPDGSLTHRSAASHYEMDDFPQEPSSRTVDRRPQMMPRPPSQVSIPEPTDPYPYNASRHNDRRSSMEVYGGYGSRAYDFPPSRNPSYHRNGRDATSPRDQPHAQSVITTPGRHGLGPMGEASAPYETMEAPFFMPSHYEYHQGKARKRSNLPKQSTEIMKTWFDQNMLNPYPSEEQKALFSVATGISMTQVSNWFINHRRRCPELRDKREKGRVNGRDD